MIARSRNTVRPSVQQSEQIKNEPKAINVGFEIITLEEYDKIVAESQAKAENAEVED